jgi:hypothetical protein
MVEQQWLFFCSCCSCDLLCEAAVDEQLVLAVEKVLYEPLLALLVDSLAWHQFGDSSGLCVLLSMHQTW